MRLLGVLDLHAGGDEVALHVGEPDAGVRDDVLGQRQGQAPVEQVGVAVLAPPVGCVGPQPGCHAQVFAVLVHPPTQAGPGIKKGLVHEFHRGFPARGLAVECEQPCRSESVDQLPADARDVGHVGDEPRRLVTSPSTATSLDINLRMASCSSPDIWAKRSSAAATSAPANPPTRS